MRKLDLTRRQSFILKIINTLGEIGNQGILKRVSADFDQTSRVTVIRDLNLLLKKGLIKKSGRGAGVKYVAKVSALEREFEVDGYFEKEADEREIKKTKLDFGVKLVWENLFSSKEMARISSLTHQYQKNISTYDPSQIKKELERITIEFSWKSSRIEGNTYTLLDTERLIKDHQEAKGKTQEEAIMILNHKKALDYAWNHPKDFRKISLRKIEEIHTLISNGLAIEKGLRKRGVGIIGTAYKPFDNVFQVKETLEGLCKLVNSLNEPLLKALVAVAGISYIQPFEDGNKRTSRLIGNALLIANNYCPLSYRSVDEIDYKKRIILFYEQHSLDSFKNLFLDQYEFAVENYFR